jgi:uncharacterized pyridoxamine 5'-phosphate oxidase family protein
MDGRKEFERIVGEVDTLVLATSVGDIPNLRFMNFIYLTDEKTLYFQSAKGSQKEKEFEKNVNVAFITLETANGAHIRVRNATVKKSKKTIFDVQALFIERMPFYKGLIEKHGNTMDLYEIHFSTATVFPDVNTSVEIEL